MRREHCGVSSTMATGKTTTGTDDAATLVMESSSDVGSDPDLDGKEDRKCKKKESRKKERRGWRRRAERARLLLGEVVQA